MNRSIPSAAAVALFAIAASSVTGASYAYDRVYSEEQLKVFEMRAVEPLTPEVAARNKWFVEHQLISGATDE
ncbi:MAG: hypothetical protein IT531_09925 [Burkholderiales bacterium]|nr:hypothetical protein [Burkholderiales bacterium]